MSKTFAQRGYLYLKSRLWQNIYVYCLDAIIIIHIIVTLILDSIKIENKMRKSEYSIMIIGIIFELILIIIQCKILYKFLFLTQIKPILCLYISKIILFSDIYLFIFKINSSQYSIPDNFITNNTTYSKLTMIFLNYSISCQTLTGISSISPKHLFVEFLTAIQVLLLGIGYGIFILSIAILRFAEKDDYYEQNINHVQNTLSSRLIPSHSIDSAPNIDNESLKKFENNKKVIKFMKNNRWLIYVKWIYDYQSFILFGTQIPRLIIMYFTCKNLNCHNNGLLIIGIILDLLLLSFNLFCVVIRMSLIRTLGSHVDISIKSLIAAYFTTLLLFGILYFDVWIQTRNTKYPSFDVISNDKDKYWRMIGHFLFFSTSTFTNVGAEIVIFGQGVIGQILNGFQMLIGVIFHTVVFGVGLLGIGEKRAIYTEKFVSEILNKQQLNLCHENKLQKGLTESISLDISQSSQFDVDIGKLVYLGTHNLQKQGLLPRQNSQMIKIAKQKTKEKLSI